MGELAGTTWSCSLSAVRALGVSEWSFSHLKQSLSSQATFKFYLREYWACARPSSAFEVVGFFVLAVVCSKPTARQHHPQLRSLASLLHLHVLAELETVLTETGGKTCGELQAILTSAGKLPVTQSGRHSVELGLGVVKKLLGHAAVGPHRTEIAKALELTPDEARELLFPLVTFKASAASGFRRFLPKFRSSPGISDRHTLVYDALPPMVTRLDLGCVLDDSPSAGERLVVVLDLDETLVSFKETVGLRLRPGVIEFLNGVAEFGRLVIFTAATEDYGHWAIQQLEMAGAPRDMARLFRQHAFPFGPVFLKDLTRLGTPLRRTVIVDNVRENFALQSGNGLEISSWFGLDTKDRALSSLLPLLRDLAARPDISVAEFIRTRALRR